MVVLAMVYTRTFYYVSYLFHRLPIRPHFKPTIGAFLSGAVGLALYFAFFQDQQVLSVLSFRRQTREAWLGPTRRSDDQPRAAALKRDRDRPRADDGSDQGRGRRRHIFGARP